MATQGINIRINIESAEAKRAIEDLSQRTDKFLRSLSSVGAVSGEAFEKSVEQVNTFSTTQGRATQALIQLNYVLQDLPYGIRGVANNIQFLTQQLILLRQSGLSTADLFKEMINLMRGPMGLLFLVTLTTSALNFLALQTRKQSEETEKTSESFDEFIKKVDTLRQSLTDGITDISAFGEKINSLREELKLAPEDLSRLTDVLRDFYGLVNLSTLGVKDAVKEFTELEKSAVALSKGVEEIGFSLKKFYETKPTAPIKFEEMDKELQKVFKLAQLNAEFEDLKRQIDAVKESTKRFKNEEELANALKNYPLKNINLALKELKNEIEEVGDATKRTALQEQYQRLEGAYRILTKAQKDKIDLQKEEIKLIEIQSKITEDAIKKVELEYLAKLKSLELDYKKGEISRELFEAQKQALEIEKQREIQRIRDEEALRILQEEIKLIELRSQVELDEVKKVELLYEAKRKALELELKRGQISQEIYQQSLTALEIERVKELQTAKRRQIEEEINLERLRVDTIRNESERLNEMRRLELLELQKLYQAGLISQEEFSLRRIAIEQDYQMRVSQMRLEFFKDLVAQFSLVAKEGTELAKVLAIANAIINTYEGATKALAKYPPPLGFLLASLVVATGLAYVNKIASVGFERGGYTGPGRKTEVAGVVHKGEFVFEKDIVDRELPNLTYIRQELQKGKTLGQILNRPVVVPQVIVNNQPKVENKIEIKADFDYLKFFVKEFRKFETYIKQKRI